MTAWAVRLSLLFLLLTPAGWALRHLDAAQDVAWWAGWAAKPPSVCYYDSRAADFRYVGAGMHAVLWGLAATIALLLARFGAASARPTWRKAGRYALLVATAFPAVVFLDRPLADRVAANLAWLETKLPEYQKIPDGVARFTAEHGRLPETEAELMGKYWPEPLPEGPGLARAWIFSPPRVATPATPDIWDPKARPALDWSAGVWEIHPGCRARAVYSPGRNYPQADDCYHMARAGDWAFYYGKHPGRPE